MRVLLAPFIEGNQYLELLEAALERRGVEVTRSETVRPLALPLLALLRSDADVLHLHWLHPYFLFGSYERFYRIPFVKVACWAFALLFVAQVRLAHRFCDRVVWTAHNRSNHERRYEDLDRWVGRQVYRAADAVQVWDDRTRADLAAYLDVDSGKARAVPHGNYCSLYPREEWPDPGEARDDLDLPAAERVFLYFGLIRPYKQVPELVATWRDLDPEGAHLLVAGNPKYPDIADRLRDLAAGRDDVTLDLRYVPDEAVSTHFAAADVAVFPYEHIFSSGSVVLAMSLATPFVAPDDGVVSSLDPGGNVVYEPGDLADGVREALDADDAELAAVGERNYERARDDHDWEEVAAATVRLYRG